MKSTLAVNRSSRLLLTFAVLATVILLHEGSSSNLVQGLPSGAAGCAGGVSAVGGFHYDYGTGSPSGRDGFSGTLAQLGTRVAIDGKPLVPGAAASSAQVYPTGTELIWTVVTNDTIANYTLRGVLFRVECFVSEAFTVTGNGEKLQYAKACDTEKGNVLGITHVDRSDKNFTSGKIRFDVPGPVSIDVNAVYRNGRIEPGDVSVFGYSGYFITIQGPPSPTPPRAPAPTSAPLPKDVCDVNGCTSVLGFKGQQLKRNFLGRCVTQCTFKGFEGILKSSGFSCGSCPKAP